MFGKLKDALKKSISIFSRKVEEEVRRPEIREETPAEPVKQEEKTEPKKKEEILNSINEVAQEPPKSAKKEIAKSEIKEQVKKQEKTIETKVAKIVTEQVKTEPTQEKSAQEQVPEQKPSFFKRLFKKPVEQKIGAVEERGSDSIKAYQIQQSEAKSEEKKGIFAKAKDILTTTKLSEKKFDDLFWDLELTLLENNVAVEVISKIKSDLKTRLVDKTLPRNLEQVIEQSLRQSVTEILSFNQLDIIAKSRQKKPFVIAFFGINGSGKTTTIAKVAKLLQDEGLSCVMAAGDTFRAAAIQQLEEHAANLKIRMIKQDYGADAAAVAFDAVKFAQKNSIDVVLIDTAGRLHSDTNLMDELKKIVKVAKPDLKVFVGESITGNDCIEQGKQFDAMIGIDGIILTKADVDQKGGTALSMSYTTKKPILYIGTGQSYADMQQFNRETVLKNLGFSSN